MKQAHRHMVNTRRACGIHLANCSRNLGRIQRNTKRKRGFRQADNGAGRSRVKGFQTVQNGRVVVGERWRLRECFCSPAVGCCLGKTIVTLS